MKYALVKNLLVKSISKKKIDYLLIFLQLYVRFADSEYNVKFEKVIDELTETKITMGIREMVLERAEKEGLAKGMAKGLEKGIEKGKIEIIENLLLMQRFTVVEIVQLSGVSEDFVLNVQKSLK